MSFAPLIRTVSATMVNSPTTSAMSTAPALMISGTRSVIMTMRMGTQGAMRRSSPIPIPM
jgi:hypothetical protein